MSDTALKKLRMNKRDPFSLENNPSTSKANPKLRRKRFKSGLKLKNERKKFTKTIMKEKLNENAKFSEISSSSMNKKISKRKAQDDCFGEPSCKKMAFPEDYSFSWTNEEYLAEAENIKIEIAQNIIKLLEKENTIPFIARYRGNLTGGLSPDKLRKIKQTYEYIQLLHKKAKNLTRKISSKEVAAETLANIIQKARTVEELEFIGSHLKQNGKKTFAQRAKQLGLEIPAKLILEGTEEVVLEQFVNPEVSGLKNVNEVKSGVKHIIADIISKDVEIHFLIDEICAKDQVKVYSKLRKGKKKDVENSKYNQYENFSQSIKTVKPHQILAINRGESENKLSVKIEIPRFLWKPLEEFCFTKWVKSNFDYELKRRLLKDSLDDAIKRLIKPFVVRRIRTKLNAEAENEAIRVFGSNLRQLLMMRPRNGHAVMGIDPGSICKTAVVSHTGDFIAYDSFSLKNQNEAQNKLKSLLLKNNCSRIALGNGTKCREIEILLNDFIKKGAFKPLNVEYTIVSEQGVSIYSCSPTAKEEFFDKDPKIIGAISIARRLLNPLSELVKVEPKHLGVGMYQHDVGEKKLETTMNEIVSECVSFVGVDVNTASYYLLK